MRKSFKLYNSITGYTLIELVITLSIMLVLSVLAHSTFRSPMEKIACKHIFSAMQMAKMRSIVTGNSSYVDFDMDGGSVFDNFYTVYLDTDGDSSFGEISNANSDNEFYESHFTMGDSLGIYPGVLLSSQTAFGLTPVNTPSNTPTGGSFSGGVIADGVGFAGGSKRIKFLPTGRPSGFGGSVYVYSINDTIGRSCAVVVALTGIIRMWRWDGSKWK